MQVSQSPTAEKQILLSVNQPLQMHQVSKSEHGDSQKRVETNEPDGDKSGRGISAREDSSQSRKRKQSPSAERRSKSPPRLPPSRATTEHDEESQHQTHSSTSTHIESELKARPKASSDSDIRPPPTREEQEKLKLEELDFVTADMYVKHHLEVYFPKEDLDLHSDTLLDCIEKVTVLYPGNVKETFPLVLPLKEGYNPIMDLVRTMEMLATDCPDVLGDPAASLGEKLYHQIVRAAKKREYSHLKTLVERANQEMEKCIQEKRFQQTAFKEKKFTYEQTIILLDQVYARAVTDPDALRQYRGFSKEVYGETRHPVIHDIIRSIPIQRKHLFLDLGSGIGNVVLQVAAETRCRAYGVELLDTPAIFARHQLLEFRARMAMYGRSVDNTVHLRRGDFLEDYKVHRILEKADILFVNNYAFESDVNLRLKQTILSMKEGAVIISFVAFRSLDYTITERNMNDVASILTVERAVYGPGGVSWTASPGEYFIHRVDRRPLQAFFEQNQNRTRASRTSRGRS